MTRPALPWSLRPPRAAARRPALSPTLDEQQALRTVLVRTLDDDRLSRGERRALAEVLEDLGDDGPARAFVRNAAFDLAEQRVEEAPAATLRWLRKVMALLVASDATGPVRRRAAFAPGEEPLELLRETLRAARHAIDVCVFTVTDDRITAELLEAHGRGVAVRLVTDDDKRHDLGSDVARLGAAGVAVRHDADPEHMHHKFAVVDRRVLLLGSYNWTRGATTNHEDLLVTEQPELVTRYTERFETLWARFGP